MRRPAQVQGNHPRSPARTARGKYLAELRRVRIAVVQLHGSTTATDSVHPTNPQEDLETCPLTPPKCYTGVPSGIRPHGRLDVKSDPLSGNDRTTIRAGRTTPSPRSAKKCRNRLMNLKRPIGRLEARNQDGFRAVHEARATGATGAKGGNGGKSE